MTWSFSKSGDVEAVKQQLERWAPATSEPDQVQLARTVIEAALAHPSFGQETIMDGTTYKTFVAVDANGSASPTSYNLVIKVTPLFQAVMPTSAPAEQPAPASA